MALVQRKEQEFRAQSAQVFLVGFEPERRARGWLRRFEIGFPFLLDPEREVYGAFGLERSFWRAWHPRNLWSYTKRFITTGKLPEVFEADPNQLGGEFIIDAQGLLRLAYYSTDPTDRPSVASLLEVLREINTQAS